MDRHIREEIIFLKREDILSTCKGNRNDDDTLLIQLGMEIDGYFRLLKNFEDYMAFWSVYKDVQHSISIEKKEENSKLIIRNAIILVHGFRFVIKGERFSVNDEKYNGERHPNATTHRLNHTGFGVDDFMTNDVGRKWLIINWMKNKFGRLQSFKNLSHNCEVISRHVYDKFNALKDYFRDIRIELKEVTYNKKTVNTNCYSPMCCVSEQGTTLPLWCDKDAWDYFLRNRSDANDKYNICFDTVPSPTQISRNLKDQILSILVPNQQKNSEGKLDSGKKRKGIKKQQLSPNDGKTRIKSKSKKQEDDDDDDDDLFDSNQIIPTRKSTSEGKSLKKKPNSIFSDSEEEGDGKVDNDKDDVTKKSSLNKSISSSNEINSNVNENELTKQIMEPLTKEEEEKINKIIEDNEHNSLSTDTFVKSEDGKDKVSWGAMKVLLNNNEKADDFEKWVNDEVVNFYCCVYLANQDTERCKRESGRKRSHFFASYFYSSLTNAHSTHSRGTYDFEAVKRWIKKVPGQDIFNLRKLFIPININNRHWTLVVISFEEKQINYYDSMYDNSGMDEMLHIYQYLMDLDVENKYTGGQHDWKFEISSKNRVPQQKNGYDCGAFVCMYCYFISNDSTLDFNQSAVYPFRKKIANAIIENGRPVLTTSESPSSEVICLEDEIGKNDTNHEILSSTEYGDEFYVAKLKKKLPVNILHILTHFLAKQSGNEFKFQYYHTSSDETTQLEVQVFSVAKGLLARLNPQQKLKSNTRNTLIPSHIKYISGANLTMEISKLSRARACTIVPIFNDNSGRLTLKLSSNGKQKETVEVKLQKGDAYLVRCKNQLDVQKKCKSNATKCSLHSQHHQLHKKHEEIPEAILLSYILPQSKDLAPRKKDTTGEDTDEKLLDETGKKYYLIMFCMN